MYRYLGTYVPTEYVCMYNIVAFYLGRLKYIVGVYIDPAKVGAHVIHPALGEYEQNPFDSFVKVSPKNINSTGNFPVLLHLLRL